VGLLFVMDEPLLGDASLSAQPFERVLLTLTAASP
jgi:hypothetical protein